MMNVKNAPHKRQQYEGLVLTVVFVLIGLLIASQSLLNAFYWFSGLGFGFVLQKSRFCFTAGFRDPLLLGSTIVAQAVLVAIGLTTVGFTLIKIAHLLLSQPMPGMEYVKPIGIYTIVGGILFGIGMVIAGGCGSGVLMRVGDGFTIQLIVLFFFIVGSLFGVRDLPWWRTHFPIIEKGVFLPDLVGWPLAVGGQLLIIVLLYRLAKRWEDAKMETD